METARTRDLSRQRSERELRVETAAAYRLLAHFGLDDMNNGHMSCRLPGEPLRYLVKPYNLTYDEVCASNLIALDLEGNIIGESDEPPSPFGFSIHSAVQAARADAKCVIHAHPPYGMALAALKIGLLPLNQINMQFYDRVAYYDYEELHISHGTGEMTAEDDEQARLVSALGDRNCLIMRNHGLLSVGATPAQAFHRLYYLEQACRLQINVLQSNVEYLLPSDAVSEAVARAEESDPRPVERMLFEALTRRLDRLDPSFRN